MPLVGHLSLLVYLAAAGLRAAPAAPVAVPVPGGDFAVAEFATAWDYTPPKPGGQVPLVSEPGRGAMFAPELQAGERAVLVTKAPLMLQACHRYRLSLDVRGALFIRWQAAVLLETADGLQVRQPLFPLVAYNAIPPPPVWEARAFEFMVPGGVAGGRLEFAWDADSAGSQRPGLANLRLFDLGPAFPPTAKTRNLALFNAGFEEPVGDDGNAPGWDSGTVVRDPGSAHQGDQFLRIDRNLTSLNLGGCDLSRWPAPVVLRVAVWARGNGHLTLGALLSQPPPYWRLQNLASPNWRLTGTWTHYEWDFSLAPQNPPATGIGISLRLQGKQLDLDDVELRLLPGASGPPP